MPSKNRPSVVLGGTTRNAYGVTVSASSEDGRRKTFCEGGRPESALRSICWQLDQMPGRWYIDVISTPQTIFDDLHPPTVRNRSGEHRWYRERQWLTRIGRIDLLRSPAVHDPKAETLPTGHAWRDSESTYRRKLKFRKRKAAEGGDAP